MTSPTVEHVRIPVDSDWIEGDLHVPADAKGLVLFAHGSGSSRFSPRNRWVAGYLAAHGFATLLMDLLTRPEAVIDERTAEWRFDIPLLARRVVAAIDWTTARRDLEKLPICCFGASTGAAAALMAAADRPDSVVAVVSRGGRPDLAGDALNRVKAPTLLIVGELDDTVLDLNQQAMRRMNAAHVRLEIVAEATHLFEEPGALEAVCRLAAAWCVQHLRPAQGVFAT
jgi:pimeloyl-ACP methyl ester carboxylesterase